MISDVSRCTLESPDLYSHRRDGEQAGRFAGLVVLRAAEESVRGGSDG
jgi:copper oxidase (laccase) domain-containing protein